MAAPEAPRTCCCKVVRRETAIVQGITAITVCKRQNTVAEIDWSRSDAPNTADGVVEAADVAAKGDSGDAVGVAEVDSGEVDHDAVAVGVRFWKPEEEG